MEELMRKLLSEKEKDEYDSGDEMELFAPNIAATAYPSGFRIVTPYFLRAVTK